MTKDKTVSDKELQLKLLYYGHSQVELQLLAGALDSEGIDYLLKRDVGLIDMAPATMFSPATEIKLYVAETDWVKAEPLAQLVVGDQWYPPKEDQLPRTV